jgi:ABC-type phosphonate transport system ATPase subunit
VDLNGVAKGLRVDARAGATVGERGSRVGKDGKGTVKTSSWVVQIVNIC